MNFSEVCRTCLSSSGLHPIFINPENHRNDSAVVFIITGIKVELNDGLPQKMCTVCVNFINDSMKFRKKCQETETQLSKIKNELEPGEEPDNKIAGVPLKQKRSRSVSSKEMESVDVKNEFLIELEREDKNIMTEYMYYDSLEESLDDKPLKELINKSEKDSNVFLYVDETDTKFESHNISAPLNDIGRNIQNSFPKNKIKKVSKSIVEEHNVNETDKNDTVLTDADESKNSKKRVTCKLCQQNLSVRSIDSHMNRRHPGADETKEKCELCDTYIRKDRMNRHRVLMHGSGCFRCGYCKAEFDAKDILVEHVSTCTAKKKRRRTNESSRELRECDICHKTMQKASLRMHKAIKHAGLGPVCEHCGKRFGNKFRLNEHYRAKHGYEKFKCSYCDFRSAGVMAMRNHERRHRGEKPFVCESCGAKFHAAYLLAQHRQSHRTEKLVKCDQCPASFKANNSLHMHKQTCHSSTLYRCSLCPRAYSCRHYAVKHLRHVHRYRGAVPPLQAVRVEHQDK